jgi:hypothetical protein
MSWQVTSIRADPQGPPAGALLISTSPIIHNFVDCGTPLVVGDCEAPAGMRSEVASSGQNRRINST